MAKRKVLTDEEFLNETFDFSRAVRVVGKAATQSEIKKLEKAKKEAVLTTRISEADLNGLKRVAAKKAIPYQTLLGHLIHEYVNGNLIDVNEVRKIFKIGIPSSSN